MTSPFTSCVVLLLLILHFGGNFSKKRHRRSLCGDSKCDPPKIKLDPRNETLKLGDRKTLKCRVSGNPIPTITWEKDGTRIDDDEEGYKIDTVAQHKKRNVVKSLLTIIAKKAVYTCIARNREGTVRSAKSYVKVRTDSGVQEYDTPSQEMCIPSINRSTYCLQYLDPSRSIYTSNGPDHIIMLEKILEALNTHLPNYKHVSARCAPYVQPFLCYYNFPYCSGSNKPGERPQKQIVCRDDCVALSTNYCRKEFENGHRDKTIQNVIPQDCSSLPTKNCISMGEEMEKVKAINRKTWYSKQVGLRESDFDPTDNCYFNKGDLYRGTINRSKSNSLCENWTYGKDGAVSLFKGHNYCRNVDQKFDRPWCYVKGHDGKLQSEVCSIPQCATPYSQTSNILYTIIPCLLFSLSLSLSIIMVAWKRHKQHYYQSAPNSPKKLVPRVNPKILELNREDLCDFRLLGDGCIGRVYTADFTGCRDGKTFTACVAVKAIIEKASQKQIEDFVREAETRGNFKHDNVAMLIGVISKEEPLSLVYEYTEHGDLHEYLLRYSPNFSEAHANNDDGQLEYPDLIVFATQIANGMSYLSTHAFVHKDLAARNVLVTNSGVLKVSDFSGLRDLYAGDYYRPPGRLPLPVRWMSPEAIKSCAFSTASDVWSYGIVLWEIFSYGSRPLFGLSNCQAMQIIAEENLTLPCPEDCSTAMFALMRECWASEPAARPKFVEIYNRLKTMDDGSYLNMSIPLQQEMPPMSNMPGNLPPPNEPDYGLQDVNSNAFHHRPSLTSSCSQSLHSGQSSAPSSGLSRHCSSSHSAAHSIPPSLLSVPHSVPSSIMMKQVPSINGHYTLPMHDNRRESNHCPLALDNTYGRPSSVNSSNLHWSSSVEQPNSYLPPASYVSSLQSYQASVRCPPTMFARQSISRTSNHESSGYDSITQGMQNNINHVYL